MTGEAAVALISACSALAGSLFTGAVTWSVMRTQLRHQASEQRATRLEQLLRELCAQCLEATSKARLELAAVGRAAVAQSDDLKLVAESELDIAVRAIFTHRTHLTLVADTKLQRKAAAMVAAFEALWYKQAQVLEEALPTSNDDLWSAQAQEEEELEEAMAQFVTAAGKALASL